MMGKKPDSCDELNTLPTRYSAQRDADFLDMNEIVSHPLTSEEIDIAAIRLGLLRPERNFSQNPFLTPKAWRKFRDLLVRWGRLRSSGHENTGVLTLRRALLSAAEAPTPHRTPSNEDYENPKYLN